MSTGSARIVPADLRRRLEQARLDTLALLRALDAALVPPTQLPQPHTQQLFELDADCAEALWALDQTAGTLDWSAMVRDSLASLASLSTARERVLERLPPSDVASVRSLEKRIRAGLNPAEAYNDVPGRDPNAR